MEPKQIRYFLAIVEKGSLSKAAQSLYLSQPTLSRFLAKLEAELGVMLFVREKNGSMQLTEAGRHYLETAYKVSQLWKELDARLEGVRQKAASNHIRLGVDGDHLLPFAQACADAVIKKYPEVQIELLCESALQLQELVLQGTVDIGVAAYLPREDSLSWTACRREEMDLAVSPLHPLTQRGDCQALHLSQLPEDTPFALMRSHTVLRDSANAYLQAMGVTPRVKTSYMRHSFLPEILADNRRVGFCPRSNVSKRLVHIPLDPPFYYYRGICMQKNRQLSLPEEFLLKLLKDHPVHRDLD